MNCIEIQNLDKVFDSNKALDNINLTLEKGKIIANTEYDKLGCVGDKTKEYNGVLIIKDVYENKDGIVVCKDNKYGIINLETGREITPIVNEVTRIYSKTDNTGKEEYYVEFDGKEASLSSYVDYVNTISINVQNNEQEQN